MKRLRFAFAALLALGGWPLSAQPPRLSVSTEWFEWSAAEEMPVERTLP